MFNNFGDKTGLLQALINEALPEQTTLIRHISEEIKQVDLWLLTVFKAAIAYFERVLPIAASSLTGNQVSLPRDQAEGFYIPRQMLTDKFRELKESDRINRNITPELTAIMLMGAAMHTAMTQLTLGNNDIKLKLTGYQLALSLAILSE